MHGLEISESNKNPRSIIRLILALGLVAILVMVIYYLTKVNKPASSESRESIVMVEKGMLTRQVADKLVEHKIIQNPTLFIIYVRLHSAEALLQAGEYVLNANMAIPEIVDILTNGKVVPRDRTITIVEGLTNKQIGKYLFDRGVTKSSSEFEEILAQNNFVTSFDFCRQFKYLGCLFPDTYKLANDASASELIQKMLTNFESKITDQMRGDIEANKQNLEDLIILASIVEKEVGRNKENLTLDDLEAMQTEREIVVGVFHNRLKIGMALESDATVNFVTGKADRQPLISDTQVESPYNTYKNQGLPPGPISNPGIGSIRAAIYPVKTEYLFFLNKIDGEAIFSKTYAEHLANKAKYLDND
ncbi:MAG: hypothetical protein A2660_00405 [Candidatus Doudnabacteria bacterium RIFCSPHIGHO2_01_FULL_45_18]|uniref:Endolytic murein transglycosylase n=1 Tax=Candidatus Doudnabacteria bacterium RIFCSPHIGHO2_01_FULL_45_18 TaxID=1817823 RepID=A0A1F5NQU0_9BACT|nr:MAG: hypothetical protein A2660_00405 [Candidatus Doudnabacteria bacterium RIFCSPHIGHO2_01_FULL_45_18]